MYCRRRFTFLGTVYVSEISSPKWRGTLGSCLILCLTFGIIYIYVIGALLPGFAGSWKIFSAWCAVPQIIGNVLSHHITILSIFVSYFKTLVASSM